MSATIVPTRPGRPIGRALAVVALLAVTLVVAPPAPAQLVGIGLSMDVQTPVTVGEANNPGSLEVRNISDVGTNPITINEITLTPACADPTPFTGCQLPDPGTITLNPQAVGSGACAGITFTPVGPDAAGRYVLVPDAPVVLDPGEGCLVDFTFNVLRSPTGDADPAVGGIQTRFFATAGGTTTTAGGTVLSPTAATNQVTTVLPATVTLTTAASAAGQTVPPGTPVSDVATVTPTPPVLPATPAPTGTVTFTLFGPGGCGGPAFGTATVPLTAAGTATSPTFAPVTPGTYNFTATYAGDANYAPITTPVGCGVPGEMFNVGPAPTQIVTLTPTPAVTAGTPVSDTATLSGGSTAPGTTPTGTITFNLYGPFTTTNPPTPPTPANCAGAPIRSVTVPVNGVGSYSTGPLTGLAPGTYFFTASYSGDTFNAPSATACGDPGETTVITQSPVTLVTNVPAPTTSPSAPFVDTATLSGGGTGAAAPTGTITFEVYGPYGPDPATDPRTCAPARLAGTLGTTTPVAGPGTYTSTNFLPPSPGAYLFIARYSGDVNNAPAATACGDPNETVDVAAFSVAIRTEATPFANVGQPINDVAFLTGGGTGANAPTGTITFELYGPFPSGPPAPAPSCAGPPIRTSVVPVNGAGNYNSGPFTGPDLVPGTYFFIARYSGDVNNFAVSTACGDPGETSVILPAPTIDVVKTAAPLTMPEPGSTPANPFVFTVLVTNTSPEPLTITSLTDNIYGDVTAIPGSTCNTAIGTVLSAAPGPGNTYTCSFPGQFNGNAGAAQTDVVTVNAVNPRNVPVTDTDDATVTLTGVPPQVDVVKTANPLSLPEPGGTFTFNVVVTNPSTVEPLTITSLTDNIYGNIATQGTCTNAIGTVLAVSPGPGNTYSCSFQGPFTGNAGATQTDIVTVIGVDNDNQSVTDTDDAIVGITNVIPQVVVEKTVNPDSLPEPGGDFTYTVVVFNNSNEPLTITSLTDNVYGNLVTRANSTCNTAIGTVLPAGGGSYTCTFTAPFTGNAGATLTDVVTVTAVDDDGTVVTDNDDAVVRLTPIPPLVQVEKTANPTSRPEPGGDFTYTVVVTNTSTVEALRITQLTDSVYGNLATRGTCTTAIGTLLAVSPGPGNTYTCAFTAPFIGNAGAALTDVVTVVGVDDDNQTATDTDDAVVTLTDVPPTITAVKTPTPVTRPEPGGSFRFDFTVTNTSNEPVTVVSLVDDVYGDLNGRGTCAIGAVLAPGASYSCFFEGSFFGDAGASQTDTITVTVVDDDGTTVTARPQATVRITDVPPTVTVEKTADPLSRPEPGGSFTFRVRVTNTSFERVQITDLTDDVYGDLNGRGTCGVGAILAPNGGTYTCEFTGDFRGPGGSAQTDVVTVRVVDNEGTTATDSDDARVTITPPPPPEARPPVVPPKVVPPKVLVRTGTNADLPLRLASGLVVVGLLMMAAARRRDGGTGGLAPASGPGDGGGPGPLGGGLPTRGGRGPGGGGGWFDPGASRPPSGTMSALVADIGMAREALAPVVPAAPARPSTSVVPAAPVAEVIAPSRSTGPRGAEVSAVDEPVSLTPLLDALVPLPLDAADEKGRRRGGGGRQGSRRAERRRRTPW